MSQLRTSPSAPGPQPVLSMLAALPGSLTFSSPRRFGFSALLLRRPPGGSAGFSLLTVLVWTLLLATLAVLLHVRIADQVILTRDVEGQLYSLILAENGIEYARTVIPHLDLSTLLKGLDGNHSGAGFPEWRNPLPFQTALRFDPSTWTPERDDGLAFRDGRLLPPGGVYRCAGPGYFLLRFSNNPEESPDLDQDHEILVRSMGVAPSRILHPLLPRVRNSVSLVEARFRQEVAFELPSPLTVFADEGVFEWDGDRFSIDGGERFGVSVATSSGADLMQDIRDSLSVQQERRIRGQGGVPSIQDATPSYRDSKTLRALHSPTFWSHFEEHLPAFSTVPDGGLRFLPNGGSWSRDFAGVLVVRGDFALEGNARITGILIHLGGGTLQIRHQAAIVGGLWMSNLDCTDGKLTSGPVSLVLADRADLLHSREAIRSALTRFPPTQIGWRILFPEMIG